MQINYYGIFISLGILVGLKISRIIQKKLAKFNPHYSSVNLEDLFLWIFFPAVIGARIYHVIDYWDYYKQNFIEIIFLWRGGLGIYGAILAGILATIIYKKIKLKGISLFIILDLGAFFLPIAQAIGRMGNYFNQELFGIPSRLPWAIYIKPENRPISFINEDYFHPLFFYESILNLCLFLVLLRLCQKERRVGLFMAVYFMGYGLIRFFLDFLRVDPWKICVLTVSQIISLGLIIISMVILVYQKNKIV